MRAHVGNIAQLQPGNRAITSRGELDGDDHVAALGGDLDVLASRGNPLHRPSKFQGEITRQQVLGRDARLGPEPSANVRRDDPNLMWCNPQRLCQVGADSMRRLAADPHRQPWGASI